MIRLTLLAALLLTGASAAPSSCAKYYYAPGGVAICALCKPGYVQTLLASGGLACAKEKRR